jgi:hypothetical protein
MDGELFSIGDQFDSKLFKENELSDNGVTLYNKQVFPQLEYVVNE